VRGVRVCIRFFCRFPAYPVATMYCDAAIQSVLFVLMLFSRADECVLLVACGNSDDDDVLSCTL